ncbi:MAG: HD domain-containing protein [Lachnospiraceae bacterium]|nr:HD domain-containing protein [Lachnospiraceae bacterium]
MKKINEMVDGDQIRGIYLCKGKRTGQTKTGKPFFSVVLGDKTGTINAKIWDTESAGIADFDEKDFVDVVGSVSIYMNSPQLKITQVRVAGEDEDDPAEYLPSTEENVGDMYDELLRFAGMVENPYFKKLLDYFFVENEESAACFKKHSAAKTVHHGFAGVLLEHTLSVTKLCACYLKMYTWLNKDLLITAALLHDIGKTRELSPFPENDYTDAGQLLGHIVIGVEMVNEAIRGIPDFPEVKANELKHCIISHHGELEFGSPKKPALAEALALNFADLTDAKLQTVKELFKNNGEGWLGYNRLFETNMRKTTK